MRAEKQTRDDLTNDQEPQRNIGKRKLSAAGGCVLPSDEEQTMRMALSVEKQPNHSASP